MLRRSLQLGLVGACFVLGLASSAVAQQDEEVLGVDDCTTAVSNQTENPSAKVTTEFSSFWGTWYIEVTYTNECTGEVTSAAYCFGAEDDHHSGSFSDTLPNTEKGDTITVTKTYSNDKGPDTTITSKITVQ